MSLALTGKEKEEAESFYTELLTAMNRKKLPFMVGGTFAFNEYSGMTRETGDIDIMIPHEDYQRILKRLAEIGYKPELLESKWLAKVYDKKNEYYTDFIWGERNGLYQVDRTWLTKAKIGKVLSHKVLLMPIEEMIRSKSYVLNRHRSDAFDVVTLILRQGKNVDWNDLITKMDPHWELLMSHILTFLFVYPSERKLIPKWVIDHLVVKLEERVSHAPTKSKITRGLLLSDDYQVGVSNWGFKPIHEMK